MTYSDDILDSIRHMLEWKLGRNMGYNYYWGFPSINVETPLILGGNMTIYNRRCKSIKKELCRKGIDAKVIRKTIFGIGCYAVDVECSTSKTIADALDIPREWVGVAVLNEDFERYLIKEDELNSKYCDCDGELVFRKPFRLVEHLGGNLVRDVDKRLDEYGFKNDGLFRDTLTGSDLLFIKVPSVKDDDKYELGKILGFNDSIGTLRDTSSFDSSVGWFYINLEQLK